MSNKYQATGRIIVLSQTQTFPSGFSKREFVIEESEGKYPQKIKFDAVKDDCTRLDAYGVGDVVTVSFNIRGNEYNGKYYVNLQAWKIEGQGKPQPTQHEKVKQNAYQPEPGMHTDHDENDDIPF